MGNKKNQEFKNDVLPKNSKKITNNSFWINGKFFSFILIATIISFTFYNFFTHPIKNHSIIEHNIMYYNRYYIFDSYIFSTRNIACNLVSKKSKKRVMV